MWPPGTKLAVLIILAGTVISIRACFLTLIQSSWRIMYVYRALAWFLSSGYILLALTGIIDIREYAMLTQWLLPLLLFGGLWSTMLHIWEERRIKRIGTHGLGDNRRSYRHRIRRWWHCWGSHKPPAGC